MGYNTNWEGELELGRQLTLDEYRELEELLDNRFGTNNQAWHSFFLSKDGTKIVPPEDEHKSYYWEESLQFIIDWLGARDIKLNGKLKWYGEENGDLGKVSVVDSVITVTDLGAQIKALME